MAKRFKITANGKVLASSAGKRHLLQTKSPKRRRSLRGTHTVDPTDSYRITAKLAIQPLAGRCQPSTLNFQPPTSPCELPTPPLPANAAPG